MYTNLYYEKNLYIFNILDISVFGAIAQNNTSGSAPIRKCGSPKVNPTYEEAFQQMVQKHQQFANGKKHL